MESWSPIIYVTYYQVPIMTFAEYRVLIWLRKRRVVYSLQLFLRQVNFFFLKVCRSKEARNLSVQNGLFLLKRTSQLHVYDCPFIRGCTMSTHPCNSAWRLHFKVLVKYSLPPEFPFCLPFANSLCSILFLSHIIHNFHLCVNFFTRANTVAALFCERSISPFFSFTSTFVMRCEKIIHAVKPSRRYGFQTLLSELTFLLVREHMFKRYTVVMSSVCSSGFPTHWRD